MSDLREPPDVASPPAGDTGPIVSGALSGLIVLCAATLAVAILDRRWDDFDDSVAKSALVGVILLGYVIAGWIAARGAGLGIGAGPLAASLAFAAWVPLRVLVWLVRDDDRGLLSGDDPILSIGAVLAQLVLAGLFGLLGAAVARRHALRQPPR